MSLDAHVLQQRGVVVEATLAKDARTHVDDERAQLVEKVCGVHEVVGTADVERVGVEQMRKDGVALRVVQLVRAEKAAPVRPHAAALGKLNTKHASQRSW